MGPPVERGGGGGRSERILKGGGVKCLFFDKSNHRIIINNYEWGNVIEITEKLTNEAQRYELFRVMVIFNWVWGGEGVMENVGPTKSWKESLLSTFLLHFVQ